MEIYNITAINDLQEYQIKSCKYDGIDNKEGAILQVSEAGEEFNVIRWLKHKFTLSLHYLSYDQSEIIIKQFIEAKKNRALVTFQKSKISKKGYLDMKSIKGEPKFYFKLEDISPKQISGTPYYELTINLAEREDLL